MVSTTPDDHSGSEDEEPAKSGTVGAAEHGQIEDETDEEATSHLREPVKGSVERSGSQVKGISVDVILLVAVEDVCREE